MRHAALLALYASGVLCLPREDPPRKVRTCALGNGDCRRRLDEQAALVAWESLRRDRFANISMYHHGFGPRPLAFDRLNVRRRNRYGTSQRIDMALERSLGMMRHPLSTLPGARRVYIDLGARNPVGVGSSIDFFRRQYPAGEAFEVYAFEADWRFASEYKNLSNVTLVQAAVASFDGDCFFSKGSSVVSSMSRHQRGDDVKVTCVSLLRWLKEHLKPEDLVVMKMDVEKAEFKLVEQLLKHQSTARLVDEMMIECHHEERGGYGPHTYRECVEMFNAMQSAGVWMHEWF